MDDVIARMMARQQAAVDADLRRPKEPVPDRAVFKMPRRPTLDQMMHAFIEDRQYEDDRIGLGDGSRDSAGAPEYKMFTGPASYDPDFIRDQVMREQPDEYLEHPDSKNGDGVDNDPLGLYSKANSRTDGMVGRAFT